MYLWDFKFLKYLYSFQRYKLPYGLAPQFQTLITPKVFNLEIRNFLSYILLYLHACMQNFKAVSQKLFVWAMSKVEGRQGARVTWTDFGPVPSFLKQLSSNFLGNLPVYMTWLKKKFKSLAFMVHKVMGTKFENWNS